MWSGIVHHKSDRKSCVLPTADCNMSDIDKIGATSFLCSNCTSQTLPAVSTHVIMTTFLPPSEEGLQWINLTCSLQVGPARYLTFGHGDREIDIRYTWIAWLATIFPYILLLNLVTWLLWVMFKLNCLRLQTKLSGMSRISSISEPEYNRNWSNWLQYK